MNYVLIIPAVWVLLGTITLVGHYRDLKKYPPVTSQTPVVSDPSDIYLKYEPYNRYENTQYN